MARQKNDQIPLGELLTKARLDKNMSRAQLAKETGISENSLVRYEKAGLEEDGQYPPSPKLARICFTLDISPLTAMFSCLSEDEYLDFCMSTTEDWLMGHPEYEYLEDQWFTLVKENRRLATALKLFLGPKPEKGSHKEENLNWIKSEGRRITDIQDAFYERLGELGHPDNPEIISRVTLLRNKKGKQKTNPHDYAAFTKNGPDKSPSRSKKSKNNAKAVDAASTKSKKGKD